MKNLITGVVILGGLSIYLILQNSHLKNEIQVLQESIGKQEKIEEITFIEDAEASAYEFIEHYFTYEGQPEREKVEAYATEYALSHLQFNRHEGLGNQGNSISSSVKNLVIYSGQSLDDRQELFVVFENEIEYDGVTSKANTLMKLHMVLREGAWKVDDFTFTQY